MSIALDEVEEEVGSEEVLDDLIGDLEAIWRRKVIRKSKHINEAGVPDHEENEYIKYRFPFALRLDDQVSFNERLLDHGFVTGLIHGEVALFYHAPVFDDRLISLHSLLNLVRKQSLGRSPTIHTLKLPQLELVVRVTLRLLLTALFCLLFSFFAAVVGAKQLLRKRLLYSAGLLEQIIFL